jgi:integrase
MVYRSKRGISVSVLSLSVRPANWLPKQVRAIFESTEGRDRLMWRILLLTGCRPGELLALQNQI